MTHQIFDVANMSLNEIVGIPTPFAHLLPKWALDPTPRTIVFTFTAPVDDEKRDAVDHIIETHSVGGTKIHPDVILLHHKEPTCRN